MSVLISVVFIVIGTGLWAASLLIASRANQGIHMPFWRNPQHHRGLSVAYRAFGAGAMVFGTSFLAPHLSHWGTAPLILFAAMGLPLLIIPLHNHSVRKSDEHRHSLDH